MFVFLSHLHVYAHDKITAEQNSHKAKTLPLYAAFKYAAMFINAMRSCALSEALKNTNFIPVKNGFICFQMIITKSSQLK
ncbi:hypothetical protein ACLBWZ_14265 [Brucellaceae bacterium C25G]